MTRLAFTTLLNRNDSVLSPHFGKAKWIMIRDETGAVAFEQNTALNGRAVAEILSRTGCTDVISAEIGEGAFRHLQQAGIRSWIAPSDIPVPQLAQMFARSELTPAIPESHTSEGCCHGTEKTGCATVGEHRGGGCCCKG